MPSAFPFFDLPGWFFGLFLHCSHCSLSPDFQDKLRHAVPLCQLWLLGNDLNVFRRPCMTLLLFALICNPNSLLVAWSWSTRDCSSFSSSARRSTSSAYRRSLIVSPCMLTPLIAGLHSTGSVTLPSSEMNECQRRNWDTLSAPQFSLEPLTQPDSYFHSEHGLSIKILQQCDQFSRNYETVQNGPEPVMPNWVKCFGVVHEAIVHRSASF